MSRRSTVSAGAALNGQPLHAGTGVLPDLDTANRDPAPLDDPHRATSASGRPLP